MTGGQHAVEAILATSQSEPTRIVVAATFTADPLLAPMSFLADHIGHTWQIESAPYGQVLQQLVDPTSVAARNRHGATVYLLRLSDLISTDTASAGAAQRIATELTAGIRGLADGRLIVVCLLHRPGEDPQVGAALEAMQRQLAAMPGVVALDRSTILAAYPTLDFDDPTSDRVGHVPFTYQGFIAIAAAVTRTITAQWRRPHKVIAVDCDNTLWAGVCGEDGSSGLRFESGHLALQRMLIQQQQQGVLLCICSKNAAADVEAVFKDRDEMLLQADHVAAWRVNWQPKSTNLCDLAATLGLGLDSFVFIDDNELECAEVAASCPDVRVLRLPDDAGGWPRLLRGCWLLDLPAATEVDRQRTAMYRQESERRAARSQAGSLREFLANLELETRFDGLTRENMARVAQLTQRTNQFNLTTTRRSPAEIAEFVASGGHCVATTVRDRFGDYGLCGVAMFRCEAATLHIDTLLLSCRVLGRAVEHRILAHLAGIAESKACTDVRLPFIATARNAPAWLFLTSLDPTATIDQGRAELTLPVGPLLSLSYEPANEVEAAETERDVAGAPRAPSSGPMDLARMQELDTVEAIAAAMRPRSALREARPEGDGSLEAMLCATYADLLGLDSVDPDQSFLDLGGHSLLAVRIFARIQELYGVELPISALLDTPDPRRLALRVLAATRAGPTALANRYVVPMLAPVEGLANLFIVAGRYGNVLNFHHIASALQGQANVHGIQYRGLLGDDQPHRGIAEAASAFLSEVRLLQSHGPYHLAGYSGGGLLAMEMAHQLVQGGEPVGLLAMLDTRLPADSAFDRRERLALRLLDLRRRGTLRSALRRKLRRLFQAPTPLPSEAPRASLTPSQLRSIRICDAFNCAALTYTPPHLELQLDLFRPEHHPRFRIGRHQMVDFVDGEARRCVEPDNGWGRFFRRVEVTSVPGEHGNMIEMPEQMVAVIRQRLGQRSNPL